LPLEVVQWIRAFRTLKDTTLLVMTGTGMLSDLGIGPLDLHYEILKWSIIARMRRCRLLYVSVGVGPLDHRLSRWIVKSALRLADYRSYRDAFSQHYLTSIGFDTSADHVYPDLVFSFPRSEMPASRNRNPSDRVVGLGLMEYYGRHCSPEQGARIYQEYISKLATFAAWLLEHKYSLRLLIGDVAYDNRVKPDILRILEENDVVHDPRQIVDEPVSSFEQLWVQLSKTDVVVATRLHNVLSAIMLGKPVIALAHHEKVRSLMAGVGLAEYCQDIANLDVQRLLDQFNELEENAEIVRSSIRQKTEEYRSALDEQYRRVFTDL
jgi:polysaccharide pyruvyl transferase WcaK-like protein